MSETFGQYIRVLRKERGLTQRGLSQMVGFRSLAHLSDIESGKRYPAKKSLGKFAEALGVTVSDLESRDTRGPVEAAKALFAQRPEMVGAFLKVLAAVQEMDAEEFVARVTGRPVAQEAPVVKVSGALTQRLETEPAAPLAPVPAVSDFKEEPREDVVPADEVEKIEPVAASVPAPSPAQEAPGVAEVRKAAVRRIPAEKASDPAQPTLF